MGVNRRIARGYLRARKGRAILTGLSIFIGVSLIFCLSSVLPLFSAAFSANPGASSASVAQVRAATGKPFPVAVLEKAPSVAALRSYAPVLELSLVLPDSLRLGAAGGAKIGSVTVLGAEAAPYAAVHGKDAKDSVALAKASGPGDLALGRDFARAAGLTEGSYITLPSPEGVARFRVAALYDDGLGSVRANALMSLSSAQSLQGLEGQASRVDLGLEPLPGGQAAAKCKAEETAKAFAAALGPSFVSGSSSVPDEFSQAMEMGGAVFDAFGFLALLMGGFIVFVSFRSLVSERRRDIGALRAIGMTRRGVIACVLYESSLLGLAGSVAGVVAGYGLLRGMLALIAPVWEGVAKMRLPEPGFDPGLAAFSVLLGLFASLAGALFPALRARRLSPVEAMRGEASDPAAKGSRARLVASISLLALSLPLAFLGDLKASSAAILCFFVGLPLAAPFLAPFLLRMFGGRLGHTASLALRSLARNGKRTVGSLFNLGLGLSILVACVSLAASLSGTFVEFIDKSMGSDYLILPSSVVLSSGNSGVSDSFKAKISALPGVAAATGLKSSSATLEGGSHSGLTAQVIGLDSGYAKVSGLRFNSGDPSAFAALDSGGAILNGILASTLGDSAKERIVLGSASDRVSLEPKAEANDFLNAKIATVYVGQAAFKRLFGERPDLLLMLRAAPGADRPALEASLRALLAQYPALGLIRSEDFKATMLRDTQSSFAIFYLLAAFLLLPSLVALGNMMAISVIERTREFGVLRAIGSSRKQLRAVISGECVFLCAMATAFALVGGLELSRFFALAVSGKGYPTVWVFPSLGLGLALAGGLLIALLSSRAPARRGARMRIVEALRFE
jgi:putative ABC transport system permease protein